MHPFFNERANNSSGGGVTRTCSIRVEVEGTREIKLGVIWLAGMQSIVVGCTRVQHYSVSVA